MTTVPGIANAANVIARALIPIVGVLVLGWSGTKLLVIYFADTLAALYTLCVLTLYGTALNDPAYVNAPGVGLWRHVRTWMGLALLPLPLVLVMGFFFGILPLFVMLDLQQIEWGEFLADPDLWRGVALQFALALFLMIQQLDWIRTAPDRTGYFRFQISCLSARWGAMILIGFFLSPYIPHIIYGPLLIVVYAATTAALELAPARVLELLGRVLNRPDLASKMPLRSKNR